MGIRFTRAARKHRIERERIRYVMEHCGLVGRQPPPIGGRVDSAVRLVFLGDDAAGVPLEVLAIELQSGDLLVIHAMPLRQKYWREYEEVKKWQQ